MDQASDATTATSEAGADTEGSEGGLAAVTASSKKSCPGWNQSLGRAATMTLIAATALGTTDARALSSERGLSTPIAKTFTSTAADSRAERCLADA